MDGDINRNNAGGKIFIFLFEGIMGAWLEPPRRGE